MRLTHEAFRGAIPRLLSVVRARVEIGSGAVPQVISAIHTICCKMATWVSPVCLIAYLPPLRLTFPHRLGHGR